MAIVNIRKFFLYLLIASVTVSAVLGIAVILLGDFGELETKVLLTAATITVTSILGLACGAFLETGRGRIVPLVGIVLAVVTAVMWLIVVWNWESQSDTFVKILTTATIAAVSIAHISLLSLARLDRRFLWSRFAAIAAIAMLASYFIFLIWADFDPEYEINARLVGVLSILIASLTVATPVFHKLSNEAGDSSKLDKEIEALRTRLSELEKRRSEITGDQVNE